MSQFKNQIDEIFHGENTELIKEALLEHPTADIADYLSDCPIDDVMKYLALIPYAESGRIVSEINRDTQNELFEKMDRYQFAFIFEFMSSDERANLFQDLEKENQIELLPYLEKSIREDVIVLSAYPPETAGGIMSTDFATILEKMSVKEALSKIKKDNPSSKMIYYIYVVDDQMKMKGIITIKDLIMAEATDLVADLYQENFIYADVNEDREQVALKIERYDLVAIPVLNSLKQLAGIVGHEEAIDVLQAEHTEDMEKFMGISPSDDEETYLDTSSFQHFKRRVSWIVALAAIGLISGIIIQKFQNVLEQLIILALYMPMMTATGGNSGSQAATVVIRALALGEVEDKKWFRIILKEAQIACLLSICVGMLVFLKINFFSAAHNIPENISITTIGMLIAVAMAAQVISSAIIGAGLPLFVRKLGGDPAVAASPAIATVVDITGLLIYFTIASLSLTL